MGRSHLADDTSPVALAWKAYQDSFTFVPVRDFAAESGYVTGAMWAAFYAGFFMGREHALQGRT